MSSDVVARLETLLARVVARRSEPRTAAPVVAAVAATSPAPRAITPAPVKAEAPRSDHPKPEAATVEVQMVVPAEARPPAIVPEALKPASEPPRPAPEPPRAAPEPSAQKAAPITLEAPRAPDAPRVPAIQARIAAPVKSTVDERAAAFSAGAKVSPGFDDDDADHVETLAFRMDKPLPKPSPVSIPPLPVSTPVLAREEPVERTAERFSPSLPPAAISAHVSVLPSQGPAASLRSLLQRSVAIRPR